MEKEERASMTRRDKKVTDSRDHMLDAFKSHCAVKVVGVFPEVKPVRQPVSRSSFIDSSPMNLLFFHQLIQGQYVQRQAHFSTALQSQQHLLIRYLKYTSGSMPSSPLGVQIFHAIVLSIFMNTNFSFNLKINFTTSAFIFFLVYNLKRKTAETCTSVAKLMGILIVLVRAWFKTENTICFASAMRNDSGREFKGRVEEKHIWCRNAHLQAWDGLCWFPIELLWHLHYRCVTSIKLLHKAADQEAWSSVLIISLKPQKRWRTHIYLQ